MVHSSRMRSVILVGLLTLTAAAACILPVRRIIGASTLSANAATEPAPAESPQGAVPNPPGGQAVQTPAQALANGQGTGSMALRDVSNAVSRGAVCNDGSPAKYYFRPGTGSGNRVWVIHLQGGGFCYDKASCNQRKSEEPGFLTSNGLPANRQGDGVEAPSPSRPSDFSSANHVFVHYCSSDLWSGDRGASEATGGRQFRGARIFQAVIEDLMDPAVTPSPSLSQARQVLFSGSSAGGAGVLVHLDWLAGQLPGAAIWGVDDAGWFVDVNPIGPSVPSPRQMTQQAYMFWGGRVDASCAAANPGSEGVCYLGPVVYPYIQTPLFVQIAQYDGPQLVGLGITLPLDDKERSFALDFGKAVRDSLTPVAAAFSPATRTHGLLQDEQFWTLPIDGVSFQEALGNWIFHRPGPIKLIGAR